MKNSLVVGVVVIICGALISIMVFYLMHIQPEKNGEVNNIGIENLAQIPSLAKQAPLQKIKEDNRFVNYSGTVTVKGELELLYWENQGFFDVCMVADSETKYLIPRDPNLWGQGVGDTRMPFFCFKNSEIAKKVLNIDERELTTNSGKCVLGNAVVEISNYVVDKLESAVTDTAVLERVVSVERFSPTCK